MCLQCPKSVKEIQREVLWLTDTQIIVEKYLDRNETYIEAREQRFDVKNDEEINC